MIELIKIVFLFGLSTSVIVGITCAGITALLMKLGIVEQY